VGKYRFELSDAAVSRGRLAGQLSRPRRGLQINDTNQSLQKWPLGPQGVYVMMGRPRLMSATRSMMVAVFLAALNIAAMIETARSYPEERVYPSRNRSHGSSFLTFARYGLVCRYELDDQGLGRRLTRIYREPPPAKLFQVLLPLIASTSITVLVLVFALSRRNGPPRGWTGDNCGVNHFRSSGLLLARYALIAVSLIGLNVAGALHAPAFRPIDSELAQHYFSGGNYFIRADGSFEYRGPCDDLVFSPESDADSKRAAADRGHSTLTRRSDAGRIKISTIVVTNDGRIVGYTGAPGWMTTEALVLRPPLRPFLEMWWTVIVSALITALVLVELWREARQQTAKGDRWRGSSEIRLPVRARIVVRLAVVAGTLVLNIAGASAGWKRYVSQPYAGVRMAERLWNSYVEDIRGNSHFVLGELEGGERLVRLMRLPQTPTLINIWSPLIASISITLFAIYFAFLCPRSRYQGVPEFSAAWFAIRGMTISTALIGLNLAGACYEPFSDGSEPPPSPQIFAELRTVADSTGNQLSRKADGRLVRTLAEESVKRPARADDYPLPLHRGDGKNVVLDTVVYGPDGGIIVYDGNPSIIERMLTRPRVIHRPARSMMQMWWASTTSAAISVVVLGMVWRQSRRRLVGPACESNEGLIGPDPK
jgi:hypothetical protein